MRSPRSTLSPCIAPRRDHFTRPAFMSEVVNASEGMSQRAAALAAFQQKSEKANDPDAARDGNMTAREKAMAALNHKGVVSGRELRGGPGVKGESQHTVAMRNLKLQDQPAAKVVPNWKMTGAQKAAAADKKVIAAGASSARAMFQNQEKALLGDDPPSPRHSFGKNPSSPRSSFVKPAVSAPSPRGPAPVVASSSAAGPGASEAEALVEHDLKLLVAGIKRLVAAGKGSLEADGSQLTTFGAIVDDEELEQQLESLVGTMKAARCVVVY